MTKEELLAEFEVARKLYQGIKRGNVVEFDNFRQKCKKYKLDWQREVLLLKPAIEREIEYHEKLRIANKFETEWKNFKTWVNNLCWQTEFPEIDTRTPAADIRHESYTPEEIETHRLYAKQQKAKRI